MNKNRRTNLDTLLDSIKKAQEENLLVYIESGVYEDSLTRFIVVNQDKGTAYTIKANEDVVLSCTCQQAIYRKQLCKHQIKVAGAFDLDLALLDYKYREEMVNKEKEKIKENEMNNYRENDNSADRKKMFENKYRSRNKY